MSHHKENPPGVDAGALSAVHNRFWSNQRYPNLVLDQLQIFRYPFWTSFHSSLTTGRSGSKDLKDFARQQDSTNNAARTK